MPMPDENSVEIWFQPIKAEVSEEEELKLLNSLSALEVQTLEKRSHPKARMEYLWTRSTLRQILAHYHGLKPLDFEFEQGPHGRPFVSHPLFAQPIHFSISHSHGLLGIAFSRERHMGLDLDCLTRSVNVETIGSTVFSANELTELMSQPDQKRMLRFFTYWTLKEAYLKALELGLSKELSKISFELSKDGRSARLRTTHSTDPDPGAWTFNTWSQTPEHLVALAYRGSSDLRLVIHQL